MSFRSEEMVLLFKTGGIRNCVDHRSVLQMDTDAWKGSYLKPNPELLGRLLYNLTAMLLCSVSTLFLRGEIIGLHFSTCQILFSFLTAVLNSSFP